MDVLIVVMKQLVCTYLYHSVWKKGIDFCARGSRAVPQKSCNKPVNSFLSDENEWKVVSNNRKPNVKRNKSFNLDGCNVEVFIAINDNEKA